MLHFVFIILTQTQKCVALCDELCFSSFAHAVAIGLNKF